MEDSVGAPGAKASARGIETTRWRPSGLRQNADALRQGLVAGIPTEVLEEGIHDEVVGRRKVPHLVAQIRVGAVNVSHDGPTEGAVDARAVVGRVGAHRG